MSTWLLAIRNLLRNRRRSLATLLALAIGSASILIFGGYTANVKFSLTSSYVRSGGHLQIQHPDFFNYGSGNPAAYGIPKYDSIISAILGDAELKLLVNVATPMLQFGGIAGNYDAGVSRTVIGTGYVPTDVNRMRLWNEYALKYQRPPLILEGAAPGSALVGLGVARVLMLCEPLNVADCPTPSAVRESSGMALPKDIALLADAEAASNSAKTPTGHTRIELLAGNARGAPNVAALKVIAAESQGFKELDELAIILQLDQAQQLVYGRSTPRATSILIQLVETSTIPRAKARIEALLSKIAPEQPLVVHSFETLNPFYVQSQQLFDTIFGFIFVLIGGIVLFTVGNTMNAAVIERTVEVGTLRAIGLRQSGVRKLFLAEGTLLGLFGALLGVVLALVAAMIFNALNLTWIPPGTSEAIPLSLIVWGQDRMMLATTVALIGTAIASAWMPAYRAAGLKIVEALRHA